MGLRAKAYDSRLPSVCADVMRKGFLSHYAACFDLYRTGVFIYLGVKRADQKKKIKIAIIILAALLGISLSALGGTLVYNRLSKVSPPLSPCRII